MNGFGLVWYPVGCYFIYRIMKSPTWPHLNSFKNLVPILSLGGLVWFTALQRAGFKEKKNQGNLGIFFGQHIPDSPQAYSLFTVPKWPSGLLNVR